MGCRDKARQKKSLVSAVGQPSWRLPPLPIFNPVFKAKMTNAVKSFSSLPATSFNRQHKKKRLKKLTNQTGKKKKKQTTRITQSTKPDPHLIPQGRDAQRAQPGVNNRGLLGQRAAAPSYGALTTADTCSPQAPRSVRRAERESEKHGGKDAGPRRTRSAAQRSPCRDGSARAPPRAAPARPHSPAGAAAGVVGGEHHAAGAGQPAHGARRRIPSADAEAERGGPAAARRAAASRRSAAQRGRAGDSSAARRDRAPPAPPPSPAATARTGCPAAPAGGSRRPLPAAERYGYPRPAPAASRRPGAAAGMEALRRRQSNVTAL